MHIYFGSIIIGGCLVLGSLLFVGLCNVVQLLWRWIDDDHLAFHSWIITRYMKLFGYDRHYGGWYSTKFYNTKKDQSTDGFLIWVFTLLILLFLPITLVISYKIYPIVLYIGLLFGLCFLARFTRRLSKKFNIHTEDKNAHNKGEEKDE